jgi:hypothetical protein
LNGEDEESIEVTAQKLEEVVFGSLILNYFKVRVSKAYCKDAQRRLPST